MQRVNDMICPDGPHQLREVLDWMSGENCAGFMTVLLAAEEGTQGGVGLDPGKTV